MIHISLTINPQANDVVRLAYTIRRLRLDMPRLEWVIDCLYGLAIHNQNSYEVADFIRMLIGWLEHRFVAENFYKHGVEFVTAIADHFELLRKTCLITQDRIRTKQDKDLRDRFNNLGHNMYRNDGNNSNNSNNSDDGDDGDDKCVVCMDAPPVMSLSNQCRHPVCLCVSCAEQCESCPLCRGIKNI